MAAVTRVFLACASALTAQTSTLGGHVYDESGAAVPRATVTITDSRGLAHSHVRCLWRGNITSPLFGQANQIAGSPNGEGFLEIASNRRLELQLRFTF